MFEQFLVLRIEVSQNVLNIFVAGHGRFILFIGPDFGVATLNILSNHNEWHEEKLDNITHEKQEGKRVGIEWVVRYMALPEHPASHEDGEHIHSVHGADGCGDSQSYPVLHTKACFVLLVDVFGLVAFI